MQRRGNSPYTRKKFMGKKGSKDKDGKEKKPALSQAEKNRAKRMKKFRYAEEKVVKSRMEINQRKRSREKIWKWKQV